MAKLSHTSEQACPCGGASYTTCCGRFLDGSEVAHTAEQLMRSRYSAYVTGNAGYLHTSWHARTRPAETVTDTSMKWLGLEVRHAKQDGDEATVEFVARCRIDGRGQRLHEISRFVREDGRWFYLDGVIQEK